MGSRKQIWRNEATRFLLAGYADPSQAVDRKGISQLIEMGGTKGRRLRQCPRGSRLQRRQPAVSLFRLLALAHRGEDDIAWFPELS